MERKTQKRKNQELEEMNKAKEKWQSVCEEAEKALETIKEWRSMGANPGAEERVSEWQKWMGVWMQAEKEIKELEQRKYNDDETLLAAYDVILAASSAVDAARKVVDAVEAYMVATAKAKKKN